MAAQVQVVKACLCSDPVDGCAEMEMAMSGLEDGYQVHVGYTDESRDNDDDERENGHVEYHDDRYYGEFHEDDQQRENDGQSRERESGFHDLSASSLITNSTNLQKE